MRGCGIVHCCPCLGKEQGNVARSCLPGLPGKKRLLEGRVQDDTDTDVHEAGTEKYRFPGGILAVRTAIPLVDFQNFKDDFAHVVLYS